VVHLAESGFVIVRTGRFHAVLDVGQPCPPTLPAHAQADSLNWVLSVDGRGAVVDTGTSTYQDLSRRSIERSTEAHNTVTVDGHDSTEVYGAFRAGRRARVRYVQVRHAAGRIEVCAEHDGYAHLEGAPIHRRTWAFGDEEIEVTDLITGSGRHDAVAHLHLTPEVLGSLIDVTSAPVEPAADDTQVAQGMSNLSSAVRLRTVVQAELPTTIRTMIRLLADDG
jgi:uncharacterized heparinase superfamily protein